MTPPLELPESRSSGHAPITHRRLGEILIENGTIDRARLNLALARQPVTHRRLGEFLVARDLAGPRAVAEALAEQWGVGPADLARDPPDPALVRSEAAELYLKHRLLPWRRAMTVTCFVTDRPEGALEGLSALGAEGSAIAVVPSRDFDAVIGECLGQALAARAAARTPEGFSVRGLGSLRLAAAGAVFLAAPLVALAGPSGFAAAVSVLLLLTAGTTALRLAALAAGTAPVRLPIRRLGEAAPGPVPVVTLLVPLFREAEMVPEIVGALRRLDYPEESLDVKLLLEAGDDETRAAVAAARLPGWIEPVVVPAGMPQTKPRALNYALDFARGEIVGILDAEDRPDRDQLRQVAGYLGTAPPDVACVQCQLSYYNATENWITRCFQIEYAIWFEVLLSGFQRLRLPIPLGGTSVYFRRSVLERLGAWDAHNVTEDADLGMRLARHGLRCAVLGSVTEEEANCRLGPWIRQRSRWLKGYMLTWLSHMRSPLRLLRELGPKGFLGLNILFLGAAVTYLAMPLFWIAVIWGVAAGEPAWAGVFPEWALLPLGISLALGQAVMLGCAALAMLRRRSFGLLVWVPTLPVYWTLGAIAAWKAVIEIVLAPYYWDKTRHGISRAFRQSARQISK